MKKDLNQEKIICSAVWYKNIAHNILNIPLLHFLPVNITKGIVFCGYRHVQCIYTKVQLYGTSNSECIQGFLTSKNRFVDRKEAALIHINNGGILKFSKTELYSEDLY